MDSSSSKSIQVLQDKLATIAQLERDFPLSRAVIDGLLAKLERELIELEKSSDPTTKDT
jgi:hypothetical protein